MEADRSTPSLDSRTTSPAGGVLGVFVLSLLLNLAFALAYEFPVPEVHDEFSYLLGADTFASGRLTNPTHPMYEFFSSYHIFHTPSYQSKYPPAQAAFLALGQVLSGEPAIGVWLSFAGACAATAWMLLPVLPAGWAAMTGLLPLFHPLLFLNWGQTYWGGGVAWLASSLLLGGLLRWWKGRGASSAAVAGVGLFILGNARPFEGAMLCALLGGAIFIALARAVSADVRRERLKQAWPLLLSLIFLLAWTGFYNLRLTGDPWLFPHAHFARIQAETPAISWRADPVPRSRAIGWLLTHFLLWWPVLALPAGCRAFPRRGLAWALAISGTFVAGVVFITTASHPHYYAPLLPLWVALLGRGLWYLNRQGGRARRVASGLLLAQVMTWGGIVAMRVWQGPPNDWAHQRQRLLQGLEAQSDESFLVMVQTAPTWPGHHELVYNPADLDSAPVLFARDFGPEKNRELFEYFPDRTLWPLAVGFSDEPPKERPHHPTP